MNINEGIIIVPPKVLEPIREYLRAVTTRVGLEGVKRLRNEYNDFVLDFTGTKYDYLQDVANKYPLRIKLAYALGNVKEYYDYSNKDYGLIKLNVNHLSDAYHGTLEHEIVHYIQHLLSKHKRLSDEIVGIGKKSFLPKGMTGSGYTIDPETGEPRYTKRVEHKLRPVEHHARLVSLYNSLLTYIIKFQEVPFNKIFTIFINAIPSLKYYKQNIPEQYKNIVRLLYKAAKDVPREKIKTFEEFDKYMREFRLELIKRTAEKRNRQ